MKVVTPKEMARIESLSYQEGCKEDSFMEKAGLGIAQYIDAFVQEHSLGEQIFLICGKGNNGGDAYVAGIELLSYGYQVWAYAVLDSSPKSPLCQKYAKLYQKMGGKIVDTLHAMSHAALIVDGIFGTGFHGKVGEPYASVIQQVNQSKKPIIAIDIPSGLNGETGKTEGPAIEAYATVFLGLPKKGFFLNEGRNYTGELHQVDFGLPHQYIERASSHFSMLTKEEIRLPKIVPNRNKYQKGHVVGLGGSPGMPGAALMASLASFRAGAGIVHLLHPDSMAQELGSLPYELIKIGYSFHKPREIISALNKGTAIFIGPAMGRSDQARKLLREVLPQLEKPTVIDADALYHLSQEEILLPERTVLTPHTGEMARLLKKESHLFLTEELLEQCQEFAEQRKVTLILKGGPTFIFHPETTPFVCPRGTPGLATAGTGDVLTGIIAALMAQGLSPLEAAQTGVYLHACAGEAAAKVWTSYSMIATDVINYLPQAFGTVVDGKMKTAQSDDL